MLRRLLAALALNMMNEALLIDMSGIMDEETFHEYISTKLNFPDYYGYNLDSFWDCITHEDQSSMPKILKVEGLAALNSFLPELHSGFVECLRDYAKEYPDRSVLFYQDSPSGEGIEFEDE